MCPLLHCPREKVELPTPPTSKTPLTPASLVSSLGSPESESHPKVFPLVSCVSSPSDENTVALGCLARDFVPNSVSFSWKFNNSTVSSEKFWTFPEVLRDGLWSASSQVALHSSSAFQGTDGYLVCEVQHPKGGKPVKTTRVVPRGELGSAHGRGRAGPGEPSPPLLSALQHPPRAQCTLTSPAPCSSSFCINSDPDHASTVSEIQVRGLQQSRHHSEQPR